MIEELRRELSARKSEIQLIKRKVSDLKGDLNEVFRGYFVDSEPILFRKITPQHPSEVEFITFKKPMVIDLDQWPVEEEFVLDMKSNKHL